MMRNLQLEYPWGHPFEQARNPLLKFEIEVQIQPATASQNVSVDFRAFRRSKRDRIRRLRAPGFSSTSQACADSASFATPCWCS